MAKLETPRMPQSGHIVDANGNLTAVYLHLIANLVACVADLQARVKALGG